MYPYKIPIKSQLKEVDKSARVQFCTWILEKCEENPDFLDNVWFSDEAHFYLDGRVNTQNNRRWSSSAPGVVTERPLHSLKCTAWCAMSSAGIIGPIWIQDDAGHAVTVTAERYRKVLNQFWIALQRRCVDTVNEQWLQQDGAPAHTAGASIKWLQERFGERILAKGTPVAWPARSPDLTPPDFFLWGHLKSRVYQTGPRSIPELKAAVRKCVKAITPQQCQDVLAHVRRRAEICLARNGAHFEHVL